MMALAALLTCACTLVFAQPAQPLPRFEAASIRPHEGPIAPEGGHLTIAGRRLTIDTFSVVGLLIFAYSVNSRQIENAASLDHTNYDIVAVAEEGQAPTRDEFRVLMRSLLAERFQLRARLEKRETPVYALVVDKSGPKFKESKPGASSTPIFESHARTQGTTLPNATMEDLANRIWANAGLDRPVIDRTGLAGRYEVKLEYTMPFQRNPAGDAGLDEITIFQAVQQLGLRLERQTAPVETLVIDHIEKPSAN
jgi:uncharacterized protein (TIGR03435 family)